MCKQKIKNGLYEIVDDIGMINDYITAMNKLSPEAQLTPEEFLALFIPIKNGLDSVQAKLLDILT